MIIIGIIIKRDTEDKKTRTEISEEIKELEDMINYAINRGILLPEVEEELRKAKEHMEVIE